jgi:hypothetical protein
VSHSVSEYVCAAEGKVDTSLGLHGELDIMTDTAQVVQERLQPLWTMMPDHKCVIEIKKPAERLEGHLLSRLLEITHARMHTHQVNDKGRM